MKQINYLEIGLAITCLVITPTFDNYGVLTSFALVLLYLFVKNRKARLKSIGFKAPKSWTKTILITAVAGVIIELGFQSIIEPLIEMAVGSKLDLSGLENIKGNIPNYLIMLSLGWIVGGLLEEILFRGFLITRIRTVFSNETLGNVVAILITSIVFGLAHMYQDWSGVIATGLVSVILGIVFIRSKEILWYSILIHGFNNTVGITILYLDAEHAVSHLFFN